MPRIIAPPAVAKSPLIDARRMLQGRDDVTLVSSAAEALQGFQLRRQWAVTVKNAGGFNPVTTEHWFYHGQYFCVMVRRFNRKGDLTTELRDMAELIGRGGGWFILVDAIAPIDPIIDQLGPVPDDFADYLARKPK